MNEAETRAALIDPALKLSGWLPGTASVNRWVPEVAVAPGRRNASGKSENPKKADYVLYINKTPVAVVEAKADTKLYNEGETQAVFYANALGLRYAYSTNGHKFLEIDLKTQASRDLPMDAFPKADFFTEKEKEIVRNALELACLNVPYSRAGGKQTRYYQERAVEAVIHRISDGKKRALLTLATGTGKTFIAYQLIYKLTAVKWQKDNLGVKAPRVLFLTDRNILANQAYEAFPFTDGYCLRCKSSTDIKLDRNIYVTLFQTLLGEDGNDTKYKIFPPDFFDMVIIDECHRGGANDESQWRTILNYFADAIHVGLTATPKCDVNGSTYEYFGEPVYVYSLAQGIDDGFLTQYRVDRCESTISNYKVTDGDLISHPELVDETAVYDNDKLEHEHFLILERDKHFVKELLNRMPLRQKGIIFCVTQAHAHRIARLINEEAAKRGINNPEYCVTVTADTGDTGDRYLRIFRKNDETIPTLLTTSQKLSTGVDAANIRSIVLYRKINSMVEFKQIIGRGTRICEGKGYFKIYDFTGATEKFSDPEWDGEVVCPNCGQNPCVCEKNHKPCPICGQWPCVCPPKPCPICGQYPCICPPSEKPQPVDIQVILSPTRVISAKWTEYVFLGGEQLEVKEFIRRLINAVKSAEDNSVAFRDRWSTADSRADFLDAMSAKGFDEGRLRDVLKMLNRQEYDVFDVLMDLAYNVEPVTRAMRAERVKEVLAEYPPKLRDFAEDILKNYVNDGVWTLTRKALSDLILLKYHSMGEALRVLGMENAKALGTFFANLQQGIYAA